MVAHGSCLCKKVQYEVELPFERFMYCHCTRCRKATGSPHAANGFVKPETFRWTQGEELVKRYETAVRRLRKRRRIDPTARGPYQTHSKPTRDTGSRG